MFRVFIVPVDEAIASIAWGLTETTAFCLKGRLRIRKALSSPWASWSATRVKRGTALPLIVTVPANIDKGRTQKLGLAVFVKRFVANLWLQCLAVESDKVNLMELPFVVPVISWRDGSVHNCVTMTFRFGPV